MAEREGRDSNLHVGDTTAANPKTLDVPSLSEFLAGTGSLLVQGKLVQVLR